MAALWVGLGTFLGDGATKAKREQAKVEMMEIGEALNVHAVGKSGTYPTDLNPIRSAFGPAMPVDPFTGLDFTYLRTPDGFELRCLGRDGLPGGSGADGDILVTHLGFGGGP
jgi:hypothetical protein